MPWGVCVGLRKINFDDTGLSLGRIHRDSLEKKCLSLVLKAQPRLKGGTLGEKVLPVLSERKSMWAMMYVCWEFLAHHKRLERQTGTGNEVLLNWQTALLITAMEVHSMKNV